MDYKTDFIFSDESAVIAHDVKKSESVFYAERSIDVKKWQSPRLEVLSYLTKCYDVVLIEADGSRGLPLKIHTERDPVIIKESTGVIGVLGAKALNRKAYEVVFGDGSERGLYVNQDYILRKLGRPHRGINIMYCYYPFDKEWPQRVSEACKDTNISFAWDYPYDDYFPYRGGIDGNHDGEPFTCMRDIRKHGQEVVLTLTCDPNVTDEQIEAIAKDLVPYGRMMVRLNHEATGDWFSFTKRASYKQVADFYVRFQRILKKIAPNVSTILCIGGLEPGSDKIEKEAEFAEAVKETDIWSVDQYLSLNWGWPYEVALKDNSKHKRSNTKEIYDGTKAAYKRFREINGGVNKPMLISEFNADGDVTGPFDQIATVKEFCEYIKADSENWLSGFTFYQFRDDGRLGLEITDPNNSDVGVEQPILGAYK